MTLENMFGPVANWFRKLHETTGLNFVVFYDPFDASRFFKGLAVTLEMAAICIIASTVIGVVVAGIHGVRFRPVVWLVDGYVQFFRNTPSIVQLYFFFFGLGPVIAIHNEYGQSVPWISGFSWAVICLSVYSGAFNAEIFRGGIEAVPHATVEAAEALGYTRLGTYIHVVLPLAVRISFPAFGNNMVNLIKSTSVAYAIAVPETLYVSSQIWADALNVGEMMNVVLVSYVAIVSFFVFLIGRVERAIRVPGIGV
ncbi:amino acid ABC transporter permease [Ferrovibrio xuzhouensis]|uniref:Amino acid ABC transporter permease n=1 Tax=Ferrovibrio xuzhouensis TaxID=1576914 RepID=A0ABV7VLE7_9PROT